MEIKLQNLPLDPDKIEFSELERLLDKFPWFSQLHVLWLVKCKRERPGEFDRELKKHVIYLRDRKRVYHIIKHDLWQELANQSFPEPAPLQDPVLIKDQDENELLEFGYLGNEEDQNSSEEGTGEGKEENENAGQNPENKATDASTGFTKWINELENRNKNQDELIDRFLEIDPGPIPADKNSTLEGDISRESVEENESFITDTLAKIYVKQGLYSKAIFAYEKLSLKYPEKSVYFAAQIEEIKSLISNK